MKKRTIYRKAKSYCMLQARVKELNELITPIKNDLVRYANAIGITKTIEIGNLTIERRLSSKTTINTEKVTADWLDRALMEGIKINYTIEKLPELNDKLNQLLNEVDCSTKATTVYAIRVKHPAKKHGLFSFFKSNPKN